MYITYTYTQTYIDIKYAFTFPLYIGNKIKENIVTSKSLNYYYKFAFLLKLFFYDIPRSIIYKY